MASAIGAALISTILQPMAAKAMNIIKDKGKAIVRSMADKAMDKVLDMPMDRTMAMVVDKVDGIVNIQRDISKLQTTLIMIQAVVQKADKKQIEDVSIRNWLHDLVDIGYEARDVLDDFITFSSCINTAEEASNPVNFISSFMLSYVGGSSSDTSKLPLAILNRLEKDIRSVRERFDEKKEEAKEFKDLISVVGGGSESVREYRRPEVGPYLNQQGDNLFLGREEVKERIMEKILHPSDDRVHVVAIWGMGGIGKTTLAQSIYNDERVKEDGHPIKNRKWLYVGENKFSANKVIREMVDDQITTGIENLSTKLIKELSRNRFLIVLDDVWDVDGSEWDLLFNPLTNVGKGGLIIITTRRIEVCTVTNTQKTYDLKPLSEDDSWLIFESRAFVDGNSDSRPDQKGIGKDIVKKLNGHPLALRVVGGSLLDKDSSTWTNFLESSDWMLIDDDNDNDNDIMSALRWSYNRLPRHLRMCFSYCSLFPKDHVFIENVLVEMWMAHDLIQKEKQKRPEDVGAHYFKQLVNTSLLQSVAGKYVMHDLIHDLALLVSNGEFATANGLLSVDQIEEVRHITLTHCDYSEIPRLCKIEKLLTLYTICRSPDSVLDDVFKQLKSIRVLVLSNLYKIKEIPNCISELKHLRYLDVSKTGVESLPYSLCHLYNLQMLAAPLYAVLPRDIVNMVNLRYVRANLSTCKGVGKLTSLQELSSIHVCEGDNIRELGDMQRLRGKLRIEGLENVSTLEGDVGALMEKQTLMDKLELQFHQPESTISAQVLDALGCPPNLMYLKIVGYTGVKSPSWMVDGKHKFTKLQTLKLYSIVGLESLPPLKELTSLKHLSLRNVGIKRLGDEFYGNLTKSKVFFPSLESLSFIEMEEWEEWSDIIIENSSASFFPRLTGLEIDKCPKLVLVLPVLKNCTSKRKREDKHPIINVANFMTSLSSLKICNCEGLKRLQLDALVSLKELEISSCKSLVQITSATCLAATIERLKIYNCEHLETMDFERLPSLKHLDVRFCNNLISIPRLVGIKFLSLLSCQSLRSLSFRNVDGLDSLEHLDINDCSVLELTFEEGSSSSSSGNSVAVPLYNICTDNMQVFKKLTGLDNFGETDENNFCKIKLYDNCLWISQFEDLKSLHKLSSLISLNIENCPQLQSLPPDFHKLSSLEALDIKSCSQLQSLPGDFYKLSSLISLYIEDCPQLQSLPPDFHKLSSLECLNMISCPQLQSFINSLVIAYQQPLEERCKLESGHVWHQIKHIRDIYLSVGEHNYISVFDGTLANYSEERGGEEGGGGEEKKENRKPLPADFHKLSSPNMLSIKSCPQLQPLPPSEDEENLKPLHFHKLSSPNMLSIKSYPQLQPLPPSDDDDDEEKEEDKEEEIHRDPDYDKEDQDDDHSDGDLFPTKIMASAIGTAAITSGASMISTILQPMAAKAMDIIKDKGKAIVRSMAMDTPMGKALDKATDKAMDNVMDKAMDTPMDRAMAVVVDKVDGIFNIERDISNLQITLRMIQGIVQEAEQKQIDNVCIQNWLCDLVDIGYEVRDVLDDFITFSSCIITAVEASNPVNFISSFMLSYFGGSSSDTSKLPLTILNRLEEDIRSVRERFDEKKREGETFATLKSVVGEGSESVCIHHRPEVGPFVNKQRDDLFLGREEVKQGIMEKILHPSDDHRVHVVAIWGMGGIGKTTLAQSIYNDERIREDDYPTENRRWLCVGVNKLNADKLIKEIVNDSSNNDDFDSLQTKLVWKSRGGRFLIVLDDVWDTDGLEWDLLFNPLTDVWKGGLIIITTRRREVCTATNTQTTYDLKPLSEEDSWSIFESCAFIDGNANSTPDLDLKCIGKKIVKKLKGLPLALKVVGCSLLDKDSSTWTNFLESKLAKDDEVMSALRWSYNHLPSHLKMCFTYCSLFSQNHVLDEKVLVEMWMAHDLIQKEEQKRPEDVGAHYFRQLVNASLLQRVDRTYMMHDLIHDLSLLVSNGEFVNSSLSNDQMKKVRHMTITPDDYSKIPRLCNIEKLLTLNTICSDEKYTNWFDDSVLDDVFKQLKSIRVLVLSSEWIYEIPDCISELKHLRYLDVSRTRVESLPDSLCHFYNLQMITAPHLFNRVELPIDIVNISSLRYVRANLSTCKGVGKLTSLQELSSIHVSKGDNIRELGDMQRLRGKLIIKGLENVTSSEDAVGALMEKQTLMDELELEFDQHLGESTISSTQVLDALGCPPNLNYLKIVGYTGLKPPSWMVDGKHKFDKLQTLKLSDCPKLKSLPPLGELTSLKDLSLSSLYGVKRLGKEFYGKFTESKVFFPSLESLSFIEMKEWEEWSDIIIENSSVSFFPRLTRLEIDHCPKLVLVLPVVKNRTSKRKREDKQPIRNATNFMTSLSRLEISYCDGLKRLQLALVSLKDLGISSCKSLVEITSAICLATAIERLQILQCEHLQKMDFERLPSLKLLDVSCCNNLISIPRLVGIKFLNLYGCQSVRSVSIHGLDSLEQLNINNCPVLELIFEEGSSSSSSSGNSVAVELQICTDKKQIFTKLFQHRFDNLKSLHIESVIEFENFGKTEEYDFCNLRSLKSLCISRCKDLKSLPAHFHKLSSLSSLKIENCPELQSLPPDFNKLSSLNNVKIVDCLKLQSLPVGGFPLSVKSLELLNCPLLYERCKDESGFDWHKIMHIPKLTIFGDHKVHRYGGDR